MSQRALTRLLRDIRACRVCEADLPLGPRPILRASATARIAIVGQAPGTKVHESGIPWDDPSGQRLRQWLDLEDHVFYDETLIAIVPTGFCYPGRLPNGGDRPPRPECAPLWHDRLVRLMPSLGLTLLVGQYAQAHYLGGRRRPTLGETVRHGKDYLPAFWPLPHPSWRVSRWLRDNPWFETDMLPPLRRRIRKILRR